jgi:hypothetical protein
MSCEEPRSDEGISFILKSWKGHLDAKTKKVNKQVLINEIYSKVEPAEIAVAMYPQWGEKISILYAVKTQGTIDGRNSAEVISDLLENLMKKREAVRISEYGTRKIRHFPDKRGGQVSSFAVVDDYILFSENPDLLKDAINVYDKKVYTNKIIRALSGSKPTKGDINIFVHNSKGIFSKNLKAWEASHYMTLLLSAELLESVSISLDLVNKENISGKITFQEKAGNTDTISDIRDDIYFFDTVIKRKCVEEGYGYNSTVMGDSDKLALSFEISGLGELWPKLFSRKKVIFKEKDDEVASSRSGGKPQNKLRQIYIPTIAIGICAVILFFFLSGKRRR